MHISHSRAGSRIVNDGYLREQSRYRVYVTVLGVVRIPWYALGIFIISGEGSLLGYNGYTSTMVLRWDRVWQY